MLGYITLLLVCQLLGEIIVRGIGAPVPGPVAGMLILFAGLVVKGGLPGGLGHAADSLLKHLSLLFVPAGVGVMTALPLVAQEWQPILVAVVGATLATIAVTGWVMQALLGADAEPEVTSEEPRQ